MRFVAIDVETANSDLASICQLGAAVFEYGAPIETFSQLINPRLPFDPINVRIHGISERMVAEAPGFTEGFDSLMQMIDGGIVASHTLFDRSAISKACARDDIVLPELVWLDTARLARRIWPKFSKSGYGLKNLAREFEIELNHHDAQSDAVAAGYILQRAIDESELTLKDIQATLTKRSNRSSVARKGDGDGSLFGEVIVFTGALQLPRREAADLAADAGGDVAAGVTKRTTLLVVGDQDIALLAGHAKSSKHRKAESLIEAGQPIRIIGETDFMAFAAITD